MIRYLFTLALLALISLTGSDQVRSRKFLTKEFQDNLILSYKWKKYGLIRKDKPLQLVLRISNRNPHKIRVSEAQIMDEMFAWEISYLEIRHKSDCSAGLKLQIKPDERSLKK